MSRARANLLLILLWGCLCPLWGNVSIPPEVEEAGHWVDAIQCMDTLHYDLDSLNSVEGMMTAVAQWQVAHPMSGAAGEFMLFVQTTVLPALDAAKPILCAKLSVLAKEIPLTALTEEQARVRWEDGRERELPWSALELEGNLERMCLLLLKEPSLGETGRNAMLAMLFFTGHKDAVETHSPVAPHWRTLLHLREVVSPEQTSLVAQWRALEEASARGEEAQMRDLARQMLAVENAPGREALRQILAGAGGPDASVEAGKVVRGAMEMLQRGELQAAFRELLYAKSRYDAIEYPERVEVNRLIQIALEIMPPVAEEERPEILLPWLRMRAPGVASRQVMQYFNRHPAAKTQWAPLERAARLEWGLDLNGAKTRASVERFGEATDLPKRTRIAIRAFLGLWKVIYGEGTVDWCGEALATKDADLMALAAIAGWLTGRLECCPQPPEVWTGTRQGKMVYLNLRRALLVEHGGKEEVFPVTYEEPEVGWTRIAHWFAERKGRIRPEKMRGIVEREAANWPIPAGKLVWDWMILEREKCLREGDAAGARALVDWMFSLRAPCVYRYHRLLAELH